ncbi:MAG: hypothetical protein U0R52_06960 [Solirubrobacterales bacterium]
MRLRSVPIALGVAVAVLAVAVAVAPARPGQKDLSYGGGGFGIGFIYDSQFPNGIDEFGSMAVTSGGKAVFAGTTDAGGFGDYAVGRLLRNGKLDHGFGDPVGHVATGDILGGDDINDVAVSGGGAVFLAGECGMATDVICVAKLNPAGDLDPGFSGDGKQTTPIGGSAGAEAAVLAGGGKVVVAGSGEVAGRQSLALVRYRPGGQPDGSFGAGGVATRGVGSSARAFDVAVQKDGKIVVVGGDTFNASNDTEIVVARFRPNGSPDQGFGKGGVARIRIGTNSLAFALAVDRRNRVLVTGTSGTGRGAVVRLTPAGKRDRSFGGDGIVRPPFGLPFYFLTDLAVQRSGRIVVAGLAGDIPGLPGATLIARLLPNGKVDRGFARHGFRIFNLGATAFSLVSVGFQPGGAILVGSKFNFGGSTVGFIATRFKG